MIFCERYTMNFEKATKQIVSFETELTSGGVRAAMTAASAKSRDLWMVEASQIVILKGFNPRVHDDKYEAHVEQLKSSIMQQGFLLSKPLEGFAGADGKIYLTDGHTRLEAYTRAVAEGFEPTPLPMVPRDKGTSMEDLTVSLVRSNNGKPLTAYETSVVCKRLATTYHREPGDIAELLGVSDKYVGQLLTLAAAPTKVREMVQSGEVSASLAIEALLKHKDGAAAALEAALGKAAGQGKAKATKKDMITPEQLKAKREKRLASRLFAAVELLLQDQKVINIINEEVYKEIDSILFERDKAQDAE
jgi:ParB family chromosome partitioning protein